MSTITNIPSSIPFTAVIFGSRARIIYPEVEALADSIKQKGLIVPIGLKPLEDGTFLLMHGGRRTRALEMLGTTDLHFGLSAHPGKPGFVITDKEDDESTDKMTELIENLHRENLTWQEELTLLVSAYRSKRREALIEGETLTFATFGKMVNGYGYSDIQAALKIHDSVVAEPEKFAECSSILNAYQKLLNDTALEAEAMLVAEQTRPQAERKVEIVIDENGREIVVVSPVTSVVIPFSSRFRLGNSLDWMHSVADSFDHIICDPDFAISPEQLDSKGTGTANAGVAQSSVEASLEDLKALINIAYSRCRSYFVFFYDLDHHEKLQATCKARGWNVQRWPITWHKTDYQNNGSPFHNTTKNEEWAMVCRKPEATLAMPAPPSVIALPSGQTVKTLGHPFAKPPELWTKLFSYFCRPGQTTFDPFMGAGSSILPAISFGLQPSGMEVQEMHYNRAVLNIQDHYRKSNPNCQFE